MATHNLGHRYDDISDYTPQSSYYDEDGGMNFFYYAAHPMNATAYAAIVAADHEDVGLVTYYGFDTRREALEYIGTAEYIGEIED